mgnify:CR=1 FL=1
MLHATETTLKHLTEDLNFGDDVDAFDEETDETEEFANRVGVKKVLNEKKENINHALAKIKKSGFGICENCGQTIDPHVLHASPESRLCRKCKKK